MMNIGTQKSIFRLLLAIAGCFLLAITLGAQTVPDLETREEKVKRGEALFHEGSDLFNQKTPASLAAAAGKFGEARVIFQRIGDKQREGFCLSWLGGTSAQLGDKRSTIDYFTQAVKLYEAVGDRLAEAQVRFSFGNILLDFNEPSAALDQLDAAQKLYQIVGEKGEAIDTLRAIGGVHHERGDDEKAMSFNQQALALARSTGDRVREAGQLSNIGALHLLSGDFEKAMAQFEEMLALGRKEKNKAIELDALDQMASAYRRKGDVPKTIEVLERSLQIAREQGDSRRETSILNSLAGTALRQSKLDSAAQFANDALRISTASGDKAGQGAALVNIGIVLSRQDENQKALESLNRAVPLLEAARDREQLALAKMLIGGVNSLLGNKGDALKTSLDSLAAARSSGNRELEAEISNNIGAVYLESGDHVKALEYFRQALPIAKQIGLKQTEARINMNIAAAMRIAGNTPAALENLKLAEQTLKSLGDNITALKSIMNRCGIYLDLGENPKALECNLEAMFLAIEGITDPNKETASIYSDIYATVLNNLGRVYVEMGARRSALDHYLRSLPLLRELKDKSRESITLTNIAGIYSEQGDTAKAKEFLDLAMAIAKETGNLGQEATILNSYGVHFADVGDKRKSIDSYGESLFLLRHLGDPRREAATLVNLLSAHDRAGHPRVAVFFGKLAVNKFQQLRSRIRAFDRQTQKTYLTKVGFTYRRLAGLLIETGRSSEAQQVLNALKDQQHLDVESADAGELPPLALTPRETDLRERLEKTGSDSKATADAIRSSGENFRRLLGQIETELTRTPDTNDKISTVSDTNQMQTVLGEIEKQTKQKAVSIYTVVGAETFHALIVSAAGVKTVSVAVREGVVNGRAKKVWALLQSDRYDPTAASKDLYDIVFKPLEKQLPPGTKTILWSLDGNLRYVPMAALFDGKQYLVERFDHVTFTRADAARLNRPVSTTWTATAFGSSKPHLVEHLGTTVSFSSLPGVGDELNNIFATEKTKAIIDGDVFLNEAFSRGSMIDRLRAKRPLVHIASHFSFRPGDEDRSFLLTGDGRAFTLADMKKQTGMFQGVELLTLSACNTAAQQADADGREVDAFFELAQRLGANSVMATLWPVADNSTPWLMRKFYELKIGKNRNKAESLRAAQMALLKGTANSSRSTVRTDPSQVQVVVEDGPGEAPRTADGRSEPFVLEKKDAKAFVPDPRKPFAHPFYWAPFVLIGNWR